MASSLELVAAATLYSVPEGFVGNLSWRSPESLTLIVDHQYLDPSTYEEGARGVDFEVLYRMERPVRVNVPATFEGPAAVVFGVTRAGALRRGMTLFCDVGPSGVLTTSTPWPERGVASLDFRLCYDDGTDRPLPVRGSAFEKETQLVTHVVEDRGPRTLLGFFVGREESVEDARTAVEALLDSRRGR